MNIIKLYTLASRHEEVTQIHIPRNSWIIDACVDNHDGDVTLIVCIDRSELIMENRTFITLRDGQEIHTDLDHLVYIGNVRIQHDFCQPLLVVFEVDKRE